MKGKLFTLEKAPFLPIGLFFLGLAYKNFDDLRKASPQSADFYYSLKFFVTFLVVGIICITTYFVIMAAERNIARNLEKTKTAQGEATDAPS